MTSTVFPTSELGFQALRGSLAARVDLDARLPTWPFRAVSGYATIFEFDRILGGDFADVLAELSRAYGDDAVTALGIDPAPPYHQVEYGHFPAFRIAGESVDVGYYEALRFAPRGDLTGSLGISLNVMAITGSSGAWSVFGERDWEIGLLLTPDRDGPWLEAGVPWFGHDVDLDSIRSPAGWGMPLTAADRDEFARHLRKRRSGP
jgi:hypothetical protein